MSGLVVAYGRPRLEELQKMFEKISHRGPYASGIWNKNRVMMAQNYLRADIGANMVQSNQVPVGNGSDGELRICYDGQIGNRQQLAYTSGLRGGPFEEERLLLHLYQDHGRGMLQYLTDAIFALVISDGEDLFAARDLLGIKTLYYGWKDKTLYLASELKSIFEVTEEVYEFPPGHSMGPKGRLIRFAELPSTPPNELHSDLDRMIKDIRAIIQRSLRNRVDFRVPTGSLLSGGIDSSVITYLASEAYREKFGKDMRLETFALGVGESSDIPNARVIATFINTDHHELILDPEGILKVLPEVIYYLESFDPSLVRSAVSNFLISRYAREHGIQILLSGEGGDEIFCGYIYLKDFSADELFARQMECIGLLHNNGALRLDRMNQCHSIRVVTPLISGELLNYAMAIPPEYKQKPEGDEKIEKWILRKAFETILPEGVVWRLKQEFSQGSGSASVLPHYFEDFISDEDLARAQAKYPMVRTKEELYYFRIFTEHFGSQHAVKTVGQWICL